MTIIVNSVNNAMTIALGESLRAMGHHVHFRNSRFWDETQFESCDLLFVGGRSRFRVVDYYRQKLPNIPIVCIDWGYFARVNAPSEATEGHWQLSIGDDINLLPEAPCATDRVDSLGIKFARQGGDPKGYVLIIGQVPTDTAVRGIKFDRWVAEQKEKYPDHKYRPHPTVQKSAKTLEQDLAGARLVVTYNSNAGWEALVAGVPVLCDPCAAYAPLSGEKIPTIAKRRDLFARAAYGQWKVSEADQAARFIHDMVTSGRQ